VFRSTHSIEEFHQYEYAPDGNTVLLLHMNETVGSAAGDYVQTKKAVLMK